MAKRIRFSIVITCWNQRDFIRATVDSALSQDHSDKEVIVVDDGSTDGSAELLERYSGSIKFVRFATNRGAIEARNRGASEAQGEYLVFLDGDDLLTPWALDIYEQIVAARHPKLILGETFWFHDTVPVEQTQAAPRRVEFVEYQDYLHKDRSIGLSASSMVIARRTFEEAGAWTPGIFHLDCQDLCAKLGTARPMILILAPVVTFYRVHATNSIHNVAPFVRMAHRLMAKVKAGSYPGAPDRLPEQCALFGGLFVFWVKRAFRAGLYAEAWKLAIRGRKMILAATLHRLVLRVRGAVPVQTMKLDRSRRFNTEAASLAVPGR